MHKLITPTTKMLLERSLSIFKKHGVSKEDIVLVEQMYEAMFNEGRLSMMKFVIDITKNKLSMKDLDKIINQA